MEQGRILLNLSVWIGFLRKRSFRNEMGRL
jgi:hypothetical protein